MDYDTPTVGGRAAADEVGSRQLDALEANCREAGIQLYELGSRHQGIVHVIGPDLGLTQPGLVIVCGDSHTSTHGAFGAIAFGIGTSEVEHVLATQCLPQRRPRDLAVTIDGELPVGVVAKDVVLGLIARNGIAGGQGCAVEYRGTAVRALSMEGRMTICNMSIEWGARVGMVAPDDTTFAYLEGRPHAPAGADWERALDHWRSLPSDPGAVFDQEIRLDAGALVPYVTWGTNPGQAAPVTGRVPQPADENEVRALRYMALTPGTAIQDIAVDRVFIGSCTNSRLEDLRAAAAVVRGRRIHPRVRAMVVPGSALVKHQAEGEGLDRVFVDAGFEWRGPPRSAVPGVNAPRPPPGGRRGPPS